MSHTPPSDTALRVADLSQTVGNAFSLRPDAATLETIARDLDLSALRKLTFVGSISAVGNTDWQLEGKLGATVVQPCVVTLEPVTTRIDADIIRRFVHDYSDPDEPDAEMPDDDSTERLSLWIDPAIVMQEALTLRIPDYPRKDDAELGQMVYTKPGEAPMTDEDARPFAGLADLQDQMKKGGH